MVRARVDQSRCRRRLCCHMFQGTVLLQSRIKRGAGDAFPPRTMTSYLIFLACIIRSPQTR
ncbi:unnamed protein product [Haemonchus placei]|uniref:Uncharacterized protein n=1 Tax=Haemonchus placei TaxID=6290 RepID=A0A0N4WNI9_HAEPC|nr:unnamed protein product [Haemonchus placei]